MNMKICTITCQNADNQGARLQTYALAKFLNGLGHQTEVINYRPSYLSFKVKLLYWPGYSLKQWVKLLLQFNGRRTAIHRHQIFVDFSKEYIPLTKKIYKSHEDLHGVIVPMPVEICAKSILEKINDSRLKSKIVKYLSLHDYGNMSEISKLYKLLP